jgi:hypothetical protein
MKIKLLVALLVFCLFAAGQPGNHKAIPGTKYSLVPPNGFVPSTSFSGFQNSELTTSIIVTEIPAPVQSLTESFTADALKAKGMILIDKQSIDFNNSKATLIKVSQQAGGTTYLKQILVFGDSKKTVLVNGIYPEANKNVEEQVKTSLLSISYNENQQDNPLDAVNFKVDISGTPFKLAKYVSGSLIYTTDGQIPTDKPTLIIGNSIAKVVKPNQKQYCIDRLKKLPGGELNKVKEINPIQIDNLKGFEIVAEGKSKDSKDELTYQVMLFDDADNYFIIIGKTSDELEKNLQVFKDIAKTFVRKV